MTEHKATHSGFIHYGDMNKNTFRCSGRQTQQWPTELTGRCSSYWLSIHRSSPRVPSRSVQMNYHRKCRFRRFSAGNSTSTGRDIQLPHGVAVTSSKRQKARHQQRLQIRLQRQWDHTFREAWHCCRFTCKRGGNKNAAKFIQDLDAASLVSECLVSDFDPVISSSLFYCLE